MDAREFDLPPPRDWQDFEDLCHALWEREWNCPTIQKHGRAGQKQSGVDIFARPGESGHFCGIQCKVKSLGTRTAQLSLCEVEAEIEAAKAFRPPLGQLIIATTAPPDTKIQEFVRVLNEQHAKEELFEVHVLAWPEILLRLGKYPELVDRFYPRAAPPVRGSTTRGERFEALRRQQSQFDGSSEPFGPGTAPVLPPDRCFGRDGDCAALVLALEGAGNTTIAVLGPPGIGKTTVVRRVATSPSVIARFQQRRWLVSADAAFDGASLATAIVVAVGLNPAGPGAFEDALIHLAAAPALLIIDNLETPWEADTLAVQDVLRRLAAVRDLSLAVSMRGNVAPSGPSFDHCPVLGPLSHDDARRMFLKVARHISPADPDLDQILLDLDGVPLAIELLAIRAAPRTALNELRAEWERLGAALAAHPDLPPARLTSVIRSVDLSLKSARLRDEGRRLFRHLGFAPGGMARDDRAALLGSTAPEAARQVLAVGLANEFADRLVLLAPIRDAARILCPATPQDIDHWVDHYLRLCGTYASMVGQRAGGAEAVARLVPEIANIEFALLREAGRAGHRALFDAIHGFGNLVTFTGQGRAEPFAALAAGFRKQGDKFSEALCVEGVADLSYARTAYLPALSKYKEALGLHLQAGDARHQAYCVMRIGFIDAVYGKYDEAIASLSHANEIFTELGDLQHQADCQRSLGEIAYNRGETAWINTAARAEAERLWQDANQLYRQAGDELGQAHCTIHLGEIAQTNGNLTLASQLCDVAAKLYADVGDSFGQANCAYMRAELALRQKDFDVARAACTEALQLYRKLGMAYNEGRCLKLFGDIEFKSDGDLDDAERYYTEALALLEQREDQQAVANCEARLAELASRRLDQETARVHFERALKKYRDAGDTGGIARCLGQLGRIAFDLADRDGARDAFEQALKLSDSMAEMDRAYCQWMAGVIAMEEGNYEPAEIHFLAAAAVYQKRASPNEAACHFQLGHARLSSSKWDEAGQSYARAAMLYHQLGDLTDEARCTMYLGDVAILSGNHEAARAPLESSLKTFRQNGDVLGQANCLRRLGELASATSQYVDARSSYDAASAMFKELGKIHDEADCAERGADAAMQSGDYAAARPGLRNAEMLYNATQNYDAAARCLQNLAHAAGQLAEHDEVRTSLERACQLYALAENVDGQAGCVAALGTVAWDLGDRVEAYRRSEEALALYLRVSDNHGIGLMHARLSKLCGADERHRHVQAAREAWSAVGRFDLAEELGTDA